MNWSRLLGSDNLPSKPLESTPSTVNLLHNFFIAESAMICWCCGIECYNCLFYVMINDEVGLCTLNSEKIREL